MKIRYLDRSDIDPIAWDSCVAESEQRLFYAFSWYLTALLINKQEEKVSGQSWGGFVVEHRGQYQAVMPVPFRWKYGLQYVQQPDFCQQLGVFSRPDWDRHRLAFDFLRALTGRFPWIISYRFNEGNEASWVSLPGLRLKKRKNYTLALDRSYEEIYRDYKTDRKINLNRARNANWRIETTTNVQSLVALHRLYQEAKIMAGRLVDVSIYDRFNVAVDELAKRGMCRVYLAKPTDCQVMSQSVEAGSLFVFDGMRIVYLFNGASEVGRKRQARLWIIDSLIRQHAGQPLLFDFESPASGAESVQVYYHSFGSAVQIYSEISYCRHPHLTQVVRSLKGWLSRGGY